MAPQDRGPPDEAGEVEDGAGAAGEGVDARFALLSELADARLVEHLLALAAQEERGEPIMPEEIVVSLRLPAVLRDAADALVPRLQESREYAWGSWSRSAVLRMAVAKGLQAIEAELDPGEGG